MLDDGDLEAAVAEGVITAAQMEALRAFVGSRRRVAERADDERFRFMRGFNDFFFAVGIALFGIGIGFFAGPSPWRNLLAAAIIWALAEFLVQRLRLVLPGILLTCLFAFFVFRLTDLDWPSISQLIGIPPFSPALRAAYYVAFGGLVPIAIAVKGLVTAIASSVFYVRFRLPFALLIIGGNLILVLLATGLMLLPGPLTMSLILLAGGCGVFAVAMSYDLSDRTRTTRSADCAFWLHLLAAPLIVHSLIQLIVPNLLTPTGLGMTTTSAATIFIIVALLTTIAILIDRRALLVSALTYLGIAIGYALTGAMRTDPAGRPALFFATLIILGAMVLALGVAWQRLRRFFLRFFPPRFVDHLPPVAFPA
jgi:hypothetical protein